MANPRPQRRKPYNGTALSIVISIDIGTTFSGASYALLRPGEVPETQGVVRFKDVSLPGGDRKVPSIVYYDPSGQAVRFGSDDTNTRQEAQESGWTICEHFKLQLLPSMIPQAHGLTCTLPPMKTATDVFTDFLSYIFQSVVYFVKTSQVDGESVWNRVKNNAHYILSHPNAWGGRQQKLMRECAISAGMITSRAADRSRLSFVSEGEASLHWCLTSRSAPSNTVVGDTFIVVDAGGGTLDFNTYQVKSLNPLTVSENAVNDCRIAGSIFVNKNAQAHTKSRLLGSPLGENKNILRLDDFEQSTKRIFNDSSRTYWISLGGWESLPQYGISDGRLKVPGSDMVEYYRDSVRELLAGVQNQIDLSRSTIKFIWLVGGFAQSPWLHSQLAAAHGPGGPSVPRPDLNTSKAVADGAIEWYLNCSVIRRQAKFTCGLEYNVVYNPSNPDHRERPTFKTASGTTMVGEQFHPFLTEGTLVTGMRAFSRRFSRDVTLGDARCMFKIIRYSGTDPSPRFMYKEKENYSFLCTVQADLTSACGPHNKKKKSVFFRGKDYYTIDFVVEIRFGVGEFTARINWMENGIQKSGPAAVIFDP